MIKKTFYILALVLLALPLYAATYYVDNGGSGAGTLADPWSITQLNAASFSAGDTIILRAEQTYNTTRIEITSTASNLTIRGSQSDDDDGCGDCWSNADSDTSPPLFDGDTLSAPIYIHVGADGLTLKDLKVGGASASIGGTAIRIDTTALDGLTLDGVDFNGHLGSGGAAAQLVSKHAIGVYGVTGTVEIKNCDIRNLMKATLEATKADSNWHCCIYPDCGACNPAANDTFGILIWYTGGKEEGQVLIHDNTIDFVWADGIQAYRVRTDTEIYNNTISRCYEDTMDFKGQTPDGYGAETLIYQNDLSFNGGGYREDSYNPSGGGLVFQGGSETPTKWSSNIKVYNNYFHDHDANAAGSGSKPSSIQYYNNYFKDNCNDIMVQMTSGASLFIYNNVSEKTSSTSCRSWQWLNDKGTFVRLGKTESIAVDGTVRIYDNTIYMASSGDGYYGIYEEGAWASSHFYIENNIFDIENASGYAQYWTDDSAQIELSDYNLYYGDGGGTNPASIKTNETHKQTGSPSFTNAAGSDFTIGAGSAAIDNGASLGVNYSDAWSPATSLPPTALTTVSRGNYGPWDIGAYEYTDPILTNPFPTAQQSCGSDPQTVSMGVTSDSNATCKYDTSDTTYALMANTFDGGGTTSHSDDVSQACGASTVYYVRCDNGTYVNQTSLEITVDVAGEPPPPSAGKNVIGGGNLKIEVGGSLTIQ